MNPTRHFLLLALLAAAPLVLAEEAAPAVKNVTPDEAEKLLKEHKEVTVLDLRTSDEFAAGHIAGAKNIDFLADDFAKKIAELDKSKPYLVHCASGGRSTRSLPQFKGQNFTNIFHLNEGFSAWAKAGKPVEK